MALMLNHYQEDRMWSNELLTRAQDFALELQRVLARSEVAPTTAVIQGIVDALANNLDTPTAFRLLTQWCIDTEAGNEGGSAGEMSRALDSYLGLSF